MSQWHPRSTRALNALVAERVMYSPSCQPFASSISLAWQVAEVTELFSSYVLRRWSTVDGLTWQIGNFWHESNPCREGFDVLAEAETVPLAICLAALQLAGVSEEEIQGACR